MRLHKLNRPLEGQPLQIIEQLNHTVQQRVNILIAYTKKYLELGATSPGRMSVKVEMVDRSKIDI